jgi:hypothetical protein
MSLKQLRARAKTIGIRIEADRDDCGWGYWLIDAATGETPWPDDNFSTSHNELAGKLDTLERERT